MSATTWRIPALYKLPLLLLCCVLLLSNESYQQHISMRALFEIYVFAAGILPVGGELCTTFHMERFFLLITMHILSSRLHPVGGTGLRSGISNFT